MRTLRAVLVLGFVVVLALVPVAAGPQGPTGRLDVALGASTTSLDLTLFFGVPVLNPAIHIYDFLVWRDETMQLKPMLAASWSFPTPTTLRFNLRRDVRFHNGDPLTADDVVYTIKRVLDPAMRSRHRSFLQEVTDVRAVGASTVELQLRNPDAHLLTRLSVIGIVPKKYIESVGEEKWQAAPVGTGPYKFQQWFRGQRLTLEANQDYWGPKPRIQTLVYRSILDDRTRIAAIRRGDADIAVNIPPFETALVKESANTSLLTTPSLRSLFVLLNTKRPPLNDVRVRRALAHAIDKNLLLKAVVQEYATSSRLPWGPQIQGYNADAAAYEYDLDKARALLREAGYPSGFSINMTAPTGRYLAGNETALAIVGQWERIGVRASVNFLEFEFWLSNYIRRYQADLGADLRGSANTTADAFHVLSTTFNPGSEGHYWSNAEVEELTVRASRTIDPNERLRLYRRIGDIVVTELPVIPLWQFVDVYAVRRRVQGFKPRPDEVIDLRNVSVR